MGDTSSLEVAQRCCAKQQVHSGHLLIARLQYSPSRCAAACALTKTCLLNHTVADPSMMCLCQCLGPYLRPCAQDTRQQARKLIQGGLQQSCSPDGLVRVLLQCTNELMQSLELVVCRFSS